MKKSITLIVLCLVTNIINAQTWSAVGNGVNGRVSCFAIYNGELYVAGQFNNPGGVSPVGLFKWNGTAFDTLPGNYLFGASRVEAMAVYNNELYLGGGFTTFNTINPSVFDFIAKWDGTTFTSVGTGCDNVVYSLAVYNGNLYVGGDMHSAGGINVNGIGRWNGTQWSSVAGGINYYGRIFELEVYNNELYAAGNFYFAALNTSCIARWNDVTWNEAGPGGISGVVYSLGIYNNELYAGGPYFTNAGGVAVNELAKWNGATWAPVGSGIGNNTAHIFALKEYHNELYIGGTFHVINGDSLRSIARYDGAVWDSVGTGVDSTNIPVDTVITPFDTTYIYPDHQISAFIEFNNCLYVGGIFNMIGGVAAHSVAEWCTPVGVEEFSALNSISVFPNPTTDKVTINCNGQFTFYELNDISGKLLIRNNITAHNFEIDLRRFKSGLYFLSIGSEKQLMHKKIFKD